MTSLEERMKDDIKTAMKAGAKADLEVLRMLISDAKNVAIASGAERSGIGDDVMLRVLQKAVKTRAESCELYARGGRQDLVDHEQFQIEVIKRYLPAVLSEAEIEVVVDTVIVELGARDKTAMGKVIKESMARLKGAADGSLVSRVVSARLR